MLVFKGALFKISLGTQHNHVLESNAQSSTNLIECVNFHFLPFTIPVSEHYSFNTFARKICTTIFARLCHSDSTFFSKAYHMQHIIAVEMMLQFVNQNHFSMTIECTLINALRVNSFITCRIFCMICCTYKTFTAHNKSNNMKIIVLCRCYFA